MTSCDNCILPCSSSSQDYTQNAANTSRPSMSFSRATAEEPTFEEANVELMRLHASLEARAGHRPIRDSATPSAEGLA